VQFLSRRLARFLVATVGLSLAATRGSAAAACHSTCAAQLAECKRTCPAGGQGRRDCRRACAERSTCTAPGARIRTLAYVVTECTADPQGRTSAKQKLVVRRGNCDPVPVMELRSSAPVPDPTGGCRLYAATRYGPGSLWGFPFQRMAVLPDASGVVFEVSKQTIPPPFRDRAIEPPEEGIFFVRANGKGLRRLGDASRFPLVAFGASAVQLGSIAGFRNVERVDYPITTDSRTLALTDYVRGPDGQDAPQLFTLDIGTRVRTQVTHFPPSGPVPFRPDFADDRTILFHTALSRDRLETGPLDVTYRIKTNGTGLEMLPTLEPVPGAHVVEQFHIAGRSTNALIVFLPETVLDFLGREVPVAELFVVEDKRALQVTHFHRPDTTTGTLRGRHLFFRASANPFGTNPGENCQVFSVNTLGGDLRQLTRFRDDARPSVGCNWDFGGVACAIEGIVLDQVTGTVIFGSSCDPFGMNPYGFQLFSMRPDGSGLRQLTATRGRVIEPDGAVSFQTVGPIAYPARARPEPRR